MEIPAYPRFYTKSKPLWVFRAPSATRDSQDIRVRFRWLRKSNILAIYSLISVYHSVLAHLYTFMYPVFWHMWEVHFSILRAERRGQGAVELQSNLMLCVHPKINRAWQAWTGGCAYHSQLLVQTLQHNKKKNNKKKHIRRPVEQADLPGRGQERADLVAALWHPGHHHVCAKLIVDGQSSLVHLQRSVLVQREIRWE